MVNFFINRPIFATVLALLMVLVGGLCAFILPISLYPAIVPPQVQITTTYTGGTAEAVAATVTTPMESKINGVKGMIYVSSDSTSNGLSRTVATFDVGYDLDIAAVDVQNKVETAKPQLPDEVKQFGVEIKKASTNMVVVVNLVSPQGTYKSEFLDNYAQINLLDVLKRVPGVSDINIFGNKYAMRIWIDPDRMAANKISPAEVVAAIRQENRQNATGKLGAEPMPAGQNQELAVTAQGRLKSPVEFEGIVVRSNPDGSIVRVRDVARVELGSETYEVAGYLDGRPAACIPVYQQADANALDIVAGVKNEMDRLKLSFPPDLDYEIAFDTTRYIHENIQEVQQTLIEAFALVILVVFVFLQSVRATIIPMIAIPVSLVATFACMAAFGFSINTLTLLGLVLAIGLVVDDAIIVVEGIEKQLGLGKQPLEAARVAMGQLTAPILTITLVLGAVFVPVAFIPGLTGRLYNQFALTIVFSFFFSALNSLTFSPAMSRLFLKAKVDHGPSKFPPFRWFNSLMTWLETSYDSICEYTTHHWYLVVLPSLVLLGLTGWLLWERPKAFIPSEDQGYLIVAVQTPDGTTKSLTTQAMEHAQAIASELEGVEHIVRFDGFNPLTQNNQTNAGAMFLTLKEWGERTEPSLRAWSLVRRLQGEMMKGLADVSAARLKADGWLDAAGRPTVPWVREQAGKYSITGVREALAIVAQPPPIQGLGTTGGFEFYLEDLAAKGPEALAGVTQQFLAQARQRPELTGLYTSFTTSVPQLYFEVDRDKIRTLRCKVSDVYDVLQANLGGLYVNDFNLYGKVWKVMLQAEGDHRRTEADIRSAHVVNADGNTVPLASLGELKQIVGPTNVPHYNLYNAAKINGGPAPGYSSGQATVAMEEVAAKVLPEGFGFEWTGTTYQEQKTGNQSAFIFGLSILCTFLFMAALYESWIRPLVIILTVPLATFGAILGLRLFNLNLDVFGQIGLVMLIGLETKNAILIIERAVELRHEGVDIVESAKIASRERLRPILMTSFAFIMGVLPMARATGAGALSRNSIGIVIAFGMLVSTVLGRFVIPVYYVLGERIGDWLAGQPTAAAAPVLTAGDAGPEPHGAASHGA